MEIVSRASLPSQVWTERERVNKRGQPLSPTLLRHKLRRTCQQTRPLRGKHLQGISGGLNLDRFRKRGERLQSTAQSLKKYGNTVDGSD